MHIKRSLPDGAPGPADWFTGDVEVRGLASPDAPALVRAAHVRFQPRARTAWHTHPRGQLLHVVEGTARVQSEGGPVEEVPTGGTVWFEPGERHWHGATPDTAMAHLAVQEIDDSGNAVDWAEHVSDEEYDG